MVSFQCEACGDVLTKKKLDPHRNRCRGCTFSCIDCMVHFAGTEYRSHTSCITEDQKYQGALYKGNKNKKVKLNPPTPESKEPKMAAAVMHHPPPQPAYVEDVDDDFEDYEDMDSDNDDDGRSADEGLPHAPTPPPVEDEGPVNVFDFLVANGTPNASNLALPKDAADEANEETSLVRYDHSAHAYLDPTGFKIDEDKSLVQYGTGPIPVERFRTPASKTERRRTKDEKELKKDKKRKRLHVDTDHVMSDAPPVLHSGLTGGLNRLMRPNVFPPSPEYSADAAETPASPLKKTKHSKSKPGRVETIGNNLVSMLTAKPKTKKRKSTSTPKAKHHRRTDADKAPKLIEYRPSSKDSKDGDKHQMIVYKPRSDLFLSFINKGPESERGCSVNKALKRFHRERSASGTSLGKVMEEKELFRSLRLRKNDRGEIVLFSV